MVKPRIGKAQEINIEQLMGAKVTVGSATDSVFVDGPARLRIRYQRDYEKLWGALLVTCNWPFPAGGPLRGPGCELAAHTIRRSSQLDQAGLTVISGRQLAFLPINSGLRKGGMAKAAVLAAVGVHQVKVRAEFPVRALVDALATRGGDFTGNVAALAESLGGLVWPLSRTLRQPFRFGVMVAAGDERLEVHMDEKSAQVVVGLQ